MNPIDIATSIVKTLIDKGFVAYFAGGWVRDFLMGHPSADVDIATDATPNQIMEIFPRTIPVGARFGVVIVVQGGHHFEVATFRKDVEYTDGRRPEKVEFSHAKEDALRRDFTINGMFYNPLTKEILDFVGGKEDIQKGIIRTIGNPIERFTEDRLRLVRAVRFACKFNFIIDTQTETAISQIATTLLPSVSMERIWQELCKMRSSPTFSEALVTLHRLNLLPTIFPDLKPLYPQDVKEKVKYLPLYPDNTPTLLCLMSLFEGFPLKKWLDIGKYLKVPIKDLKLLEFYYSAEEILQKEIEQVPLWNLAHFYVHPHSQLILDVMAAKFPEDEKTHFLKIHAKTRHHLHDDIMRIEKKSPVVTSDILLRNGIKPGPHMGKLLLMAEQMAINERLHYPEDILHKLQS